MQPVKLAENNGRRAGTKGESQCQVSFNNEIWVHNGPYHKPPKITMGICTSSLHTSGYLKWHAEVIEDIQGICAGSCCGISIDGHYVLIIGCTCILRETAHFARILACFSAVAGFE